MVIYADEIDFIEVDELPCPVCGSPLSLIRGRHKETGHILIIVMCETCDEFHGFVVDTGLRVEDLEKFIKARVFRFYSISSIFSMYLMRPSSIST